MLAETSTNDEIPPSSKPEKPSMSLHAGPSAFLRRAFDVILAGTGLLLLLPLFAAAAVVVRLDGPGPLLFRQERVGRYGRPFTILKFRTMRPLAAATSATVGNTERVLRWGQILRNSKIDELPQLFNVLAGDMSLVGPRPELLRYVALWSEADQTTVLSVRPGLTDLASLVYCYEERLLAGRNDPEDYYCRAIIPRKLRLCRFYVRRAGLALDLWLICQTIGVLAGLPLRLARLQLSAEQSGSSHD